MWLDEFIETDVAGHHRPESVYQFAQAMIPRMFEDREHQDHSNIHATAEIVGIWEKFKDLASKCDCDPLVLQPLAEACFNQMLLKAGK
jgi:hypothetical protein